MAEGPRNRRTVCLFGLSADPPHQGHVGIVQALQQRNEWDEIWVLPVYRHTFAVRESCIYNIVEPRYARARAVVVRCCCCALEGRVD
jgi:nicotinic acid mononucleotide adenylyltransferase